MWNVFLSSRLLQGTFIGLVLFCAGCLLYLQHVERENARDLARTAAEAKRYEKILKRAPQDTAADGHWHGDEWHPTPHAAPELGGKPSSAQFQGAPSATASVNDLLAALPPSAVPEDIPDRYKLPEAWEDLYAIRNDGRTNPDFPLSDIRAFLDEVRVYVVENHNPRRPIAEVWPAFMEVDIIYNRLAEQELGVFPGKRGGARVGWTYEQMWAFPEHEALVLENIKRGDTLNSQMALVYQIEMGLDSPNWNLVVLEDGREFRMRRNTRYQFGTLGIALAHPERSPLIVVEDTFTVSDEELQRLGGWNYNINPFTQKPITLYREPLPGLDGIGIHLGILPPPEKRE